MLKRKGISIPFFLCKKFNIFVNKNTMGNNKTDNVRTMDVNSIKEDDKNFNKGSEIGAELNFKSQVKFGAGRSILVDKNYINMAGNKTIEAYKRNGGTKVKVIDSDGSELIVVRRTDIDINTNIGREMALADNATAKASIMWDAETLSEFGTDFDIEEWEVYPDNKRNIIGNDYEADINVNNKDYIIVYLTKQHLSKLEQLQNIFDVDNNEDVFLHLLENYKK